jgi:hypothetical protein
MYLQYTKIRETIPNYHKIAEWPKTYQIAAKIYHHFPFQGPPKYAQVWIFCMKTHYLATLVRWKEMQKVLMVAHFSVPKTLNIKRPHPWPHLSQIAQFFPTGIMALSFLILND